MNGLLLPVKGLTCTSASPQGDPQLHVHIREPTRGSPDSRAHPRAHKGIARLARTCARPQGDRQTRAHMREPTRRSPAPRTHPRTHAHIREPTRVSQAKRAGLPCAQRPYSRRSRRQPLPRAPTPRHAPTAPYPRNADYRSRTWCLSSVFRLGLRAKVAVI